MKKLLILSLFVCSVVQLNAMDPKEMEKKGKPSGSEKKSVTIEDAGNSFAKYIAKIKTLRRRIKKLKSHSEDLKFENMRARKKIKTLEDKLKPKPYVCKIPNCNCGRQ